jgi:lipopolysaccharide transport system permease protein/teichoic acid transport system permease protein
MYLGIIWWFLDPLLMMLTYAFIYLVIFKLSTPHYFVFLLSGLVMWRLISSTVNQNTVSIISKVGIFESTPAPKQIFPLITVLSETIMFLAAFVLVFIAVLLDHVPITWHYIELIPVILVTFVFLYGVGLLIAHYGAFIADLRPAIVYALRILFYLSPIFYSPLLLPASIREFYYLNPLTVIIGNYRATIIDGVSPDYLGLGILLLVGALLILIGWRLIEKHDKDYGRLK